jgi:SAM-dependent methyltransferase
VPRFRRQRPEICSRENHVPKAITHRRIGQVAANAVHTFSPEMIDDDTSAASDLQQRPRRHPGAEQRTRYDRVSGAMPEMPLDAGRVGVIVLPRSELRHSVLSHSDLVSPLSRNDLINYTRVKWQAMRCYRQREVALYEYDAYFYDFLSSFALESARRLIPRLVSVLPLRSVVDFGCGEGAWLRAWSETGASVMGVDGPYIDRDRLLIRPGEFHPADIAEPINLGRQFDLAQSLEVAEHLPSTKAKTFVDTLTAHGPLILFSAAVPGQGGENHVNEQPLDYWRALFRKRGYLPIDYLRPLIIGEAAIQSWYRYNILLYVKEHYVEELPGSVRDCVVADADCLREYRPLACRVQQMLVRRLPVHAVNRISRLRAAMAARRRAPSGGLTSVR